MSRSAELSLISVLLQSNRVRELELVGLSGNFLYISGNSVSWQATPHLRHDLETTFYGHVEMGSSLDGVELMQVVGHDTHVDELLAELDLYSGLVVDAPQQDRLVEKRDPRSEESFQRGFTGAVDLAWVVGVDDEFLGLEIFGPACPQPGLLALGEVDLERRG